MLPIGWVSPDRGVIFTLGLANHGYEGEFAAKVITQHSRLFGVAVGWSVRSFHSARPISPVHGEYGKQENPSSQGLSVEGRVANSATRILCTLAGQFQPCV